MTSEPLDLGDDHRLFWVGFAPDRTLNPQYANLPDVERCGAIVQHKMPDGKWCSGYVRFDIAALAHLEPGRPKWTVHSMEPLTLSPSIECRACKDHGYIRNGRWERAQ
jgi:hypothetical protein